MCLPALLYGCETLEVDKHYNQQTSSFSQQMLDAHFKNISVKHQLTFVETDGMDTMDLIIGAVNETGSVIPYVAQMRILEIIR